MVAARETHIAFGPDRCLVGTVCTPGEGIEDSGPFVVFLNAGIIHRAGPNRMYVRIARALAEVGISSLRFDLAGIGDSIVSPNAVAIDLLSRLAGDIDEALDLARDRFGASRFVLLGLCAGADNAVRTMDRRSDVVGVVALDLNTDRTWRYYVHHYARRALEPSAWLNLVLGRLNLIRRLHRAVDPDGEPDSYALRRSSTHIPLASLREMFRHFVEADRRLLCIFTSGLPHQYNYRRQLLDLVPGVDFGDRLTLVYHPDADHTFSHPRLQERLVSEVREWISSSKIEQVPVA